MSSFSDVDSSPRADALLRYLDDTDSFMSAFKAYVVGALHRYAPGGWRSMLAVWSATIP